MSLRVLCAATPATMNPGVSGHTHFTFQILDFPQVICHDSHRKDIPVPPTPLTNILKSHLHCPFSCFCWCNKCSSLIPTQSSSLILASPHQMFRASYQGFASARSGIYINMRAQIHIQNLGVRWGTGLGVKITPK